MHGVTVALPSLLARPKLCSVHYSAIVLYIIQLCIPETCGLLSPNSSTPFEHTIELRQICDLYDIPIEERFRRHEVARHCGEQDVLNLPQHRLVRVVYLTIARRAVNQRFRHVEERKLSKEGMEAWLLRGPVDLRVRAVNSDVRSFSDHHVPAGRDA